MREQATGHEDGIKDKAGTEDETRIENGDRTEQEAET